MRFKKSNRPIKMNSLSFTLSLRGQKGFSLLLTEAIPLLQSQKRPLFHSWGIASLAFAMTADSKGRSSNIWGALPS
jgi:hypothetical protein